MQILIELDEDVYNDLQAMNWSNVMWASPELIAIHNGQVLPKGHGRLIDISKYEKYFNTVITYDDGNHIHSVYTSRIPTIIEADKEE